MRDRLARCSDGGRVARAKGGKIGNHISHAAKGTPTKRLLTLREAADLIRELTQTSRPQVSSGVRRIGPSSSQWKRCNSRRVHRVLFATVARLRPPRVIRVLMNVARVNASLRLRSHALVRPFRLELCTHFTGNARKAIRAKFPLIVASRQYCPTAIVPATPYTSS